MSRSRYTPTVADQYRVRDLAAIGMTEDDIAAQLRLPMAQLKKRFRLELKQGAATGREHALKKLHELAISGDNFSALSLWVKSRCGWRDTGAAPAPLAASTRGVLYNFVPELPSTPAAPPPTGEHRP
jgi:hypothetical protein